MLRYIPRLLIIGPPCQDQEFVTRSYSLFDPSYMCFVLVRLCPRFSLCFIANLDGNNVKNYSNKICFLLLQNLPNSV